jgi:hypothetical protein
MLSYLVYSSAFDALPEAARHAIYNRFIEVLTGKDDNPEYEHLSSATREAILSILIETKPEFATYAAALTKNN